MKTILLTLLLLTSLYPQNTLLLLMGDDAGAPSLLGLESNGDLVLTAPYTLATSTYIDATGASESIEQINTLNNHRIRQNGTVKKVRLYSSNKAEVTAVYIKIWRKDGTTYDLVGQSENILSKISSSGWVEATLDTPIDSVLEGDYYGIRIEISGAVTQPYGSINSANSGYQLLDSTLATSNLNWETATATTTTIAMGIYMEAPIFVTIGNSIIAGHPDHYSYIEGSSSAEDKTNSIAYWMNKLNGYSYQNMGIGSQTSTQIKDRFTTDVVNLKPNFVIIEGGVNDVATAVLTTTIISNFDTMLTACKTNDITPVILGITSWTDGTEAQMQQIDSINTQLEALALGYNGYYVNANTDIGLFRSGGDAGNLWDIKLAYQVDDDIHFNRYGYAQIAQSIYSSTTGLTNQIALPTNGLGLFLDLLYASNNTKDANNKITAILDLSGNALTTAQADTSKAFTFVSGSGAYGITDDYMLTTHNTALNSTANGLSYELWYKGTQGTQYLLDKKNQSPSFTLSNSNPGQLAVNGNGGAYTVAKTAAVSWSVWHYLAFTYDGGAVAGSWKLYVDGVAITPSSTSGTFATLANTTNALEIGRRNNGTNYLSGYIGKIRVYQRVLTPAEILNNYNLEKTQFGL